MEPEHDQRRRPHEAGDDLIYLPQGDFPGAQAASLSFSAACRKKAFALLLDEIERVSASNFLPFPALSSRAHTRDLA